MENNVSVDQRRAAIEQFVALHRRALATQGSVAVTWRRRSGRKIGPYFLLVVRGADGLQRSIYLGKSGPLVEEVRRVLTILQEPARERRQLAEVRKQLRSALKHAHQQLDHELAKKALFRKGSEIRGWSRPESSGSITNIPASLGISVS